MNVVIIIMVVCCVAGIIVFKSPSKIRQRPRPEFLESVRKIMEGRLEQIPGSDDGYKMSFTFQGREFVFEDIFMPGFQGKVNRAYLKVQTNSVFTMTLSEKKGRGTIRSDIFMVSRVSDVDDPVMRNVQIPETLREFRVHSNDNLKATQIFNDGKMAKIFADFKNMDSRGYPISALRIVDGQLILEFHADPRFRPSLAELNNNAASIEDYANRLSLLARKIENF
jgi:hypothetical protein